MTVRLRRQDVIIFLIYSQFEAIQKLDYGRMVCKTYIFIITFFLTKTVIRTKKSNTALILLL